MIKIAPLVKQGFLFARSFRDLELISSKLDTIKAMLASLDQRTANLERAAGVQQQRRERLW